MSARFKAGKKNEKKEAATANSNRPNAGETSSTKSLIV